TGVQLEADFSVELLLTIFHPKTALHDGGVIVRNGRVAAAACIFPVSQRETLDRSLCLRHRAGLGLTEESDAVAVVVSEETGAISICHRRRIERDFTPETFRKRIGEILLQSSYDEETDSEKLAGEDHLTPPRDHALVSDQKERGNDPPPDDGADNAAAQSRNPPQATHRSMAYFAPEAHASACPARAEARPSARTSQDEHALESVVMVGLRPAAPRLAQKTHEIFLFPTS